MVCHSFKPLSYVLLSTVVLNSALLSTSSVDDLHHDTDRVSPSTFGSFNFSELEQTLYDVELLKVPLPESALMKQSNEEKPGVCQTDSYDHTHTLLWLAIHLGKIAG